MNKRLEKEFGEQTAEKRGWHWALTSFVVDAWGEIESKTDTWYQKVGKLKLPAKRWLSFLYPKMRSKKQTAYKKERNGKS